MSGQQQGSSGLDALQGVHNGATGDHGKLQGLKDTNGSLNSGGGVQELQSDEIDAAFDNARASVEINSIELQRLETLSRSTTEKLHVLWNEMGLSDDERNRQLCSLVEQVEQVFVQKVADETALRDEYIHAAKNLDDEIRSLAQLLGEERTPLQQRPESSNLMLSLSMLRSEIVHFKAIKETRMKSLKFVNEKLQTIWSELGWEASESLMNLENFLTPAGMKEYDAALTGLQHDRTKRIATVQELISDINSLFEELSFEPTCDEDRAIVAGGDLLGITDNAVELLQRRARELTNEKIQRTEQLKLLGSRIQPLWEQLSVDREERRQFFMQNCGLGMEVIEKCKQELERLLQLKKDQMATLVAEAQESIVALWDEMRYTEEQRELFSQQVMTGPVDESMLEACEHEITLLSIQAELYRPILRTIEKYIQLCGERDELDTLKADPGRLLQRYNGKTLQDELKMEQRVKVGIPKLIEKIETSVAAYEAEHGPFLLDGKPFVESMKENEIAFNERKNEEKSRKKHLQAQHSCENYHGHNAKPSGVGTLRKIHSVSALKDRQRGNMKT